MRSLFLKIFFYFLLIIVLVTATVIALSFLRDREFPPISHQDFARQAISEYGRSAILSYEKKGEDGFNHYTDKLRRKTGIKLRLFDQNGKPLTQKRIPHRIQQMALQAKRSGEVVFPKFGARNVLAAMVTGDSKIPYLVAISLPGQPPPQHLIKEISRSFFGWRILVLLIITASVCYFLARSLTAPIGRLRLATKEFAAGKLSTRIGDKISGKNEIAELATDFDEMAEKIETLVDRQKDLLRDISHELRSPLTRLGIALELARQQQKDNSQTKSLQRIELETERMNHMIGQLLNLAKLENSSNSEFSGQPFDLVVLLQELTADANYEAKNRGCAVELNAPEKQHINGTKDLLAQALENIIRNAINYTAENSTVTVTLSTEKSSLKVSVADHGKGVPDAALPKLFEPFYRVAAARDRQSGGTGIGLAIAERAIKLHHGTISAKNCPAGGLIVEITLPI